jgi:uncharacterized membrane protein
MAGARRAAVNGLIAAVVATTVAYAVGRDRRMALAAGLLSGTMSAVASWLGGSAGGRTEAPG